MISGSSDDGLRRSVGGSVRFEAVRFLCRGRARRVCRRTVALTRGGSTVTARRFELLVDGWPSGRFDTGCNDRWVTRLATKRAQSLLDQRTATGLERAAVRGWYGLQGAGEVGNGDIRALWIFTGCSIGSMSSCCVRDIWATHLDVVPGAASRVTSLEG
jgi:hypothetical protein